MHLTIRSSPRGTARWKIAVFIEPIMSSVIKRILFLSAFATSQLLNALPAAPAAADAAQLVSRGLPSTVVR